MKPSRPPPQGNGPLPAAVPLATSEAASEPVCFQRCREMGAGPLELRPWLASQGCDGGGGGTRQLITSAQLAVAPTLCQQGSPAALPLSEKGPHRALVGKLVN